jgi:hypothetical protein
MIYEADKSSYRSELTKALAGNGPDHADGLHPDSIVIFKELYKMGYKGAIQGPTFAINQN